MNRGYTKQTKLFDTHFTNSMKCKLCVYCRLRETTIGDILERFKTYDDLLCARGLGKESIRSFVNMLNENNIEHNYDAPLYTNYEELEKQMKNKTPDEFVKMINKIITLKLGHANELTLEQQKVLTNFLEQEYDIIK